MSFNLCDLPPEEKALIEVDKAAAYVVWKERNGKLATAELAAANRQLLAQIEERERIEATRAAISCGLPAPSTIVVLSLSTLT